MKSPMNRNLDACASPPLVSLSVDGCACQSGGAPTTLVLHVISGLGIGGAETALYRLIRSSHGGQFRHAVVSLTPGGTVATMLRTLDVDVTTFDFRTAPLSGFFGLLALIRRRRPAIVQTWLYHADMVGGIAARLAGGRNVVWGIRTTDLTTGDAKLTVAVKKLCAYLSRRVPSAIVCVAEAARRAHVNTGYDGSRMVVIPNGFDLEQLVVAPTQAAALREECGVPPAAIVIGTLGRFNASKDQENFVRAAGVLAQRDGRLRFLMIGRGVDRDNLELAHWIDATGHAESFVLLGERADVPVCLAAMDIFCLSSRAEGFPNVVGEAMAVGLPCVVTDVGDAALLVGDAGVVVPKEDSAALAAGMAKLLDMGEARRHLETRAKERIRTEFSLERTRERFEALYRRLTMEGRN